MIGWRELWNVDPDIEDEDVPAAPNVENAEIDLPEPPPKTPRTSDSAISRGHRGNFLEAKNNTTSPLTSPTPTPDPICDPEAFDVLAAHLSAVVACRTSEELIDAGVTYWRHQLDVMPTPATKQQAKVVAFCRRAMFEQWVREAATAGWTERDLFGFAGLKAKSGHGLVVGLAMMPPSSRPVVTAVTADHAEVVTAAGSRIRIPRNAGTAAPIWT